MSGLDVLCPGTKNTESLSVPLVQSHVQCRPVFVQNQNNPKNEQKLLKNYQQSYKIKIFRDKNQPQVNDFVHSARLARSNVLIHW